MSATSNICTLRRDGDAALILDQTQLPYRARHVHLRTLHDVEAAIERMQVRGAPLIGATAAFGVAIALREDASDARLAEALERLAATRPTAVNLRWALDRMRRRLQPIHPSLRYQEAWAEAEAIRGEDVATCGAIGRHGVELLLEIANGRAGPVRLMTHCNAGALATTGAGTALAPVYEAHRRGLAVHVWVSETRPRNQGLLTAWELRELGVPHGLIVDNAAASLLAGGEVDLVITGADRIAANGDSANKIGTRLKALAAHDSSVPFYIAAPLSTVDFDCPVGANIPIEDRGPDEIRMVHGEDDSGEVRALCSMPAGTCAPNPAFDVTPARLITGIITEHGVCAPERLSTLRETKGP